MTMMMTTRRLLYINVCWNNLTAKARYTLVTKLNSARSLLLARSLPTGSESSIYWCWVVTWKKWKKKNTVDFVESRLLPKLATKSTVAGFGNKLATTWIRHIPVFDIFLFLWILVTVDFVASVRGQSDTVDFQQSRPCWIQLCHQCVPGSRVKPTINSAHLRKFNRCWHCQQQRAAAVSNYHLTTTILYRNNYNR